MKYLQSFCKNQRGSMSILWVILIFIGVLVATAFVDFLVKSYTLQEVQSIMDTAGVSALRTGVDEQKLRVEEFHVNENLVEKTYQKLVSSRFSKAEKILHYEFKRTKLEEFKENWGIGETTKARHQALIDSTMIIVVEASSIFDVNEGVARAYYDSRDSANFDVTYLGKTEDGKVELSVRSVSRIVYR